MFKFGIWRQAEVMVISLTTHLLALALPLALLQTYDRIIPNAAQGTLVFLVIGVGVAIFMEALLRFGRSVLFAHIGARLEAETSVRLVDRIIRADIRAVERRGVAALADTIRSVGRVRDFWSGNAATALYEAPFVFVYIGLIAYIGGWLAVIPLALTLAALIASLGLARLVRTACRVRNAAEADQRSFVWCVFEGLGEVKSLAAETAIARDFAALQARLMHAGAVLETRMGWIRENGATLGQLATILIVGFGAILVIDGRLTTGGLAACTLLAGRSIAPAMAAFTYLGRLGEAREAQTKIDETLALPEAPVFRGRAGETRAFEDGNLEVSAPVLGRQALTVPAGSLVHLTGPDTAQLSHLMSCIAALSEDEAISVLYDGAPAGAFDPIGFRASVVLVTGSPSLVPGSILNNLTLFDPRLNAAARDLADQLGLTPYVDKLRNGMMTAVGPLAAETLDTGVCQRIGIIRGLLRRPRVLLLDQAANALDIDGVRRLGAVLHGLRGQTTTLLTTGNPTLIDRCDRSVELAMESL